MPPGSYGILPVGVPFLLNNYMYIGVLRKLYISF